MIVTQCHHHAEAVSGHRWADGCGARRRHAVSTPSSSKRSRKFLRLPARRPCAHSGSADVTVDVVVVGAGIVGLSTAATLLRQQDPPLSVAIVDRKVPCAGATGAGGSQCICCQHAACVVVHERAPCTASCGYACCRCPRPGLHLAGASEHWRYCMGPCQAQQGTMASNVGRAAPGLNPLAGGAVAGGCVCPT